MPVSEAKRKNNDKYNAKCDTIQIRPLKPVGQRIREAADRSGKSLQAYILDAVDRQIAADEDGENIPSGVILNLMEWLKEHGHSADDQIDCLTFLAKERRMD